MILLLLIPLLGAAACAVAPRPAAKLVALLFSLGTLLVGILAAITFYSSGADELLTKDPLTLAAIGFSFKLGVNAIGLWLMILTVGITPLAIAASFDSIKEREKEYYGWMLVLLAVMNGVFISRDALLFYVFFELTLIPMFFIIGIWGGPERRYAANKFFLFTFSGGVLTLATLIYLGSRYGTFDILELIKAAQSGRGAVEALNYKEQFFVFLGLLAGFAVKVPLFPVHTWLPLAHTEAPTAGSVILAGVLLKLGTYGILTVAIPIGLISKDGTSQFPELIWFLGTLSVVAIIYGALVAWVQQDIKKLVAYSSVSHLGFCVLGMLALNSIGIQASILYMINHGISTGAMFLCIGMIYDRYHTRDINKLSGLAARMPILAFFFVFFMMSSIGLPGLNGFVSEFFTVQGAFYSPYLGWKFAAGAATGVILGAVYMLHMTAKVIFGPLKTPLDEVVSTGPHGGGVGDAEGSHEVQATHGQSDTGHGAHENSAHGHDSHGKPGDIGLREIAILVPLALAAILLGFKPGLVTDQKMQESVSAIYSGVQPMKSVSNAPVAELPVPPPPHH